MKRDRTAASTWIACAIAVALVATASANSAPEVSNVLAEQRSGTAIVDIYYDVYDADGDLLVVTATCSDGTGGWVHVTTTEQGSDIGEGITSGQGKQIVWDAVHDMPGHVGSDYIVRVSACESAEAPDVLLVPAGTFTMGDGQEGYGGECEHEVTLTRSFWLGQYEVTNQQYIEAVQWAYDRGFVTATSSSVSDNLDGSTVELVDLDSFYCEIAFSDGVFSLRDVGHGGDNGSHPMKEVEWYGAARYCDWLSLWAGLPRAYAHSGDWSCNGGYPYGADGYRLPTDAEWEYAAQHDDERIYPWGGESPDCSRANFHDYYGSGQLCVGWTSPVGSWSDGDSELGFSDLAGNVFEWCNDWRVTCLGIQPATDPVGPSAGVYRVARGGDFLASPQHLRCASRHFDSPAVEFMGFRVARTADR